MENKRNFPILSFGDSFYYTSFGFETFIPNWLFRDSQKAMLNLQNE